MKMYAEDSGQRVVPILWTDVKNGDIVFVDRPFGDRPNGDAYATPANIASGPFKISGSASNRWIAKLGAVTRTPFDNERLYVPIGDSMPAGIAHSAADTILFLGKQLNRVASKLLRVAEWLQKREQY